MTAPLHEPTRRHGLAGLVMLFATLLGGGRMQAQCFAGSLYPGTTIVAANDGSATLISALNWAGEYAQVQLVAGNTYRFSSTTLTDHITVTSAAGSGVLTYGTQPVTHTATYTGVHYVHFHTGAACGTEAVARTTRVQRTTCTAGTTSCGGGNEAITEVRFGTIKHLTAGCGTNGYTDASFLSTSVWKGNSYGITVVNAAPVAGDQVSVFIDWDRDLVIDEAGEGFALTTMNYGTFTGTITVPATAVEQAVTMRVRLMRGAGSVPACGSTTFGEVQDYTLQVLPAGMVYAGGGGRGDAQQFLSSAANTSFVYAGGHGRGDAAQLTLAPALASSIFSGGNGRGDAALLALAPPLASSIFSGGSGRGDAALTALASPLASSIYSGGTGRGDAALLALAPPLASGIYAGGVGRGDGIQFLDALSLSIRLRPHLVLEGPYDATTGLMNDALRTLPAFPTTEPYGALGYAHVGSGGEQVGASVLATTGTDAIVDWVVIELRDPDNTGLVVATRSALLQRDGDVVAPDGTSPVAFSVPAGPYHVAVRHRNHLGAMTSDPVTINTFVSTLDLASSATSTYGIQARKSVTGAVPAQVLWAGDVNFSSQLKYTGSGNDRDPVLQAVGGTTPTAVVSNDYRAADVNLDGTVKYTGSANDRDLILLNIGGAVPTAVRTAQLP